MYKNNNNYYHDIYCLCQIVFLVRIGSYSRIAFPDDFLEMQTGGLCLPGLSGRPHTLPVGDLLVVGGV